MNIKFWGSREYPKPYPPALEQNIARVERIFSSARQQFGQDGPWLFGRFCAADAMFAPVCLRFRSYGVVLQDVVAQAYVGTVLASPHLAEWCAAAMLEEAAGKAIPHYDAQYASKTTPRPQL
jgi:glutathione S-transferase